MLDGLVQMLYWPACRMILMSGWPHTGGLQQEGEEGQTARHLGGVQQGLEQGGREQADAQALHSPAFMQLCCSIFRSTGQAMWPGRQPHLNCKPK